MLCATLSRPRNLSMSSARPCSDATSNGSEPSDSNSAGGTLYLSSFAVGGTGSRHISFRIALSSSPKRGLESAICPPGMQIRGRSDSEKQVRIGFRDTNARALSHAKDSVTSANHVAVHLGRWGGGRPRWPLTTVRWQILPRESQDSLRIGSSATAPSLGKLHFPFSANQRLLRWVEVQN